MSRPAVFLDRDGVLNEAIVRDGKPYPPADVSETVMAPRAAELLVRLRAAGFLLLVVTNQPDVGRGKVTRESVEAIHAHLSATLPLDGIFVCYHDDRDHCACRKPKPGLLLDAAREHDVDLSASYMIGDRWRDVTAGRSAGCRTVFIDHGYNEGVSGIAPDIHVRSLAEAVERIL